MGILKKPSLFFPLENAISAADVSPKITEKLIMDGQKIKKPGLSRVKSPPSAFGEGLGVRSRF